MEVRQVSDMLLLLPEALRARLGDQAAKELVDLINESNRTVKESIIITTGDRYERRLVEVKGDLEKQIAETRTDVIKWMFIFWVGQIAVMFGFLSYFLPK